MRHLTGIPHLLGLLEHGLPRRDRHAAAGQALEPDVHRRATRRGRSAAAGSARPRDDSVAFGLGLRRTARDSRPAALSALRPHVAGRLRQRSRPTVFVSASRSTSAHGSPDQQFATLGAAVGSAAVEQFRDTGTISSAPHGFATPTRYDTQGKRFGMRGHGHTSSRSTSASRARCAVCGTGETTLATCRSSRVGRPCRRRRSVGTNDQLWHTHTAAASRTSSNVLGDATTLDRTGDVRRHVLAQRRHVLRGSDAPRS